MKLNFRDLKQQKFTVEAEPSDTIGQVKEKIAAEKGWEASTQKLIYSGKILADANTVESYNIVESGFIVCMVTKPKAAPAAAPAAAAAASASVNVPPPSTPAQQPSSTPAPPAAPVANPMPAASNPPPATPTPSQPTTGATQEQGWNNPSAMLMGSRNEDTIREMEAMGFERSQIDRALRAAFYNPDRAIEYLLNGIPENANTEQRQAQTAAGQGSVPAAAAAAAAAGAGATAASDSAAGDEPVNLFEAAAAQAQGGGGRSSAARGGAGGVGAGLGAQGAGAGQGQVDMNFLRSLPHFQQLRQLVQQNPAMLEPILQQVAEGNPQLAQMIGQNQEQFLQLLAEDAGGNAIGGLGDAGPLPPGAVPISVTEEERDAIERLCRLGFSRDQVIQAYFACDKNEELAANFLFEQPDDDDLPPGQ